MCHVTWYGEDSGMESVFEYVIMQKISIGRGFNVCVLQFMGFSFDFLRLSVLHKGFFHETRRRGMSGAATSN